MKKVVVRKTENRGWGVFAIEAIAVDETIETAPVIVMSAAEMELLNKTKLHDYIFHWENGTCCMAMGIIPIFNHESPSNCEYFQDYEEGTIEIKSVRAIEAGEELTINYQGDSDNQEEVWFTVST